MIPFNPPFDNPFNPDTTMADDMAEMFGVTDGSLDWMADTQQWLEDAGKAILEGRDVQPGALVIGRHYVAERVSAPVQYTGIV